MRPDDAKLQELILYIACRCEEDPSFGKTKLYKILFYSDFAAFEKTERSITGEEYRRYPQGPVPAHGEDALLSLNEAGVLEIIERDRFGKAQQRPRALRDMKAGTLTPEELAYVDEAVRFLWGRSARETSDLSHQFIGWLAAGDYEPIPYETVFLDNSPMTEAEEEYCRELVRAGL